MSLLRSTALVALFSIFLRVSAELALDLSVTGMDYKNSKTLRGHAKPNTGPDQITDIADLKVTTTIANTGDTKLKLLKDPRGALNPFATETFAVTNEDGNAPTFIGARVSIGLVTIY